MIIVQGTTFKTFKSDQWRRFKKNSNLGTMGMAYLQSIIEAKSKHIFKHWWRLGFQCRMADKIKEAALSVNNKMGFANMSTIRPMLDARFWGKDSQDNFFCKTKKKYAEAVSTIMNDSQKNALECRGLSNVMALRGLQLALGNKRFDSCLKAFLGKTQLKIPLPLTGKHFVVDENLSASKGSYIYEGDRVFRPGDIIAVSNTRDEAAGTQWMVENGICVGWLEKDGKVQFDEPLFVGGGVPGKVMTEAQIREFVYNQAPSSDKITGDRAAHFAEKTLGTTPCPHKLDERRDSGQLIHGLNVVPNVYMFANVDRIGVLGGRTDIIL